MLKIFLMKAVEKFTKIPYLTFRWPSRWLRRAIRISGAELPRLLEPDDLI